MSAKNTRASRRKSQSSGQIQLNLEWSSWENARNAFYKAFNGHPGSSRQHILQNHDEFANHILSSHRLQCRECHSPARHGTGGMPPRLGAGDQESEAPLPLRGPRADVSDMGTQTEARILLMKLPHGALLRLPGSRRRKRDLRLLMKQRRAEAARLQAEQGIAIEKKKPVKRPKEANLEPSRKSRRIMDQAKADVERIIEDLIMNLPIDRPLTTQGAKEDQQRLASDDKEMSKCAPTRSKYVKTPSASGDAKEDQNLANKDQKSSEGGNTQSSIPRNLPVDERLTAQGAKEEQSSACDDKKMSERAPTQIFNVKTASTARAEELRLSNNDQRSSEDGRPRSVDESHPQTSKSKNNPPQDNKRKTANDGKPIGKSKRKVISKFDRSKISSSSSQPIHSKVSWSSELSPVSVPAFTGAPPGPTTRLDSSDPEMTFFDLLFPPDLINHLVFETNQFAMRSIKGKGGRHWVRTTAEEMKAFLGLQILCSIKKLTHSSVVWAISFSPSERINAWEVMHQDRFDALLKYFQLCGCPGNQLILENRYKVLATLNDCSRSQFDPHQDCTVQETSIKVEGEEEVHLCLLVDSENGYCYEFRVFHPEKEGQDQHSSRDNVVLDLTRRLQNNNYIVNLSEQFTSLDLLRNLEGRGILSRGSVNCSTRNIRSLPDQQYFDAVGQNLVLQQGTIFVCSWFNPVSTRMVVSTADDPLETYEVRQTYKGQVMKSQSPTAVLRHMKCMYTNRFNHTHPPPGWTNRRGLCIFWFALDVAIANATILRHGSERLKNNMGNTFRKRLAKQLIGNFRGGFQLDPDQPSVTSGPGVQTVSQSSDRTASYVQSVIAGTKPLNLHSSNMGVSVPMVSDGPVAQTQPLQSDSFKANHPSTKVALLLNPSSNTNNGGIQILKIVESSRLPSCPLQPTNIVSDSRGMRHDLIPEVASGSVQRARLLDGTDVQSDSTQVAINPLILNECIRMQSDCTISAQHEDPNDACMQSPALESSHCNDDSQLTNSNNDKVMQSTVLSNLPDVHSMNLNDGIHMQSIPIDDVEVVVNSDGTNMQSNKADDGCSMKNNDDKSMQSPGRQHEIMSHIHPVIANIGDRMQSNTNDDVMPNNGFEAYSDSSFVKPLELEVVHSLDDVVEMIKIEAMD